MWKSILCSTVWQINIYMYYYRPQRSCGQGNIFTSVCLSTGGVYLPQCMLGYPPRSRPPRADPPRNRHPPGTKYTPRLSTPPGKQTPAYGQRAAGTHPTGMHSCSNLSSKAACLETWDFQRRRINVKKEIRVAIYWHFCEIWGFVEVSKKIFFLFSLTWTTHYSYHKTANAKPKASANEPYKLSIKMRCRWWSHCKALYIACFFSEVDPGWGRPTRTNRSIDLVMLWSVTSYEVKQLQQLL